MTVSYGDRLNRDIGPDNITIRISTEREVGIGAIMAYCSGVRLSASRANVGVLES